MQAKAFKLLILPSVSNMQQVVNKFPFPIALSKGHFKDLEIIFKGSQTKVFHKGLDVANFDFVWLCSSWRSRDLAYATQLYLDHKNVPHTRVEKGTSKLTDHMAFSLNDIPSPNTLFIGHKEVEKSFDRIKKTCGYPLVLKDVRGSRGAHSEKVENQEELLQKIEGLPRHKKFFFQQYIANEYDWGIMVADGKVVSGEKSYPCQGEFRNNTCNGAKEVFVDPENIPENIKQIAIKTSKALNLAWSRTDIIIDKNTQKPFVMEVNRLPGITSRSSEVDGAYEFLSAQIKNLIEKN